MAHFVASLCRLSRQVASPGHGKFPRISKARPRPHGTKPILVEERLARIVISAASVKLTVQALINNHTKDAFSNDGNRCGSTQNMR
jgi:hypothetical protein